MEKQIKNWLKKFKLSESTISMILGALVVIVVGVLVFNYFSKKEQQPTTVSEEEQPSITEVKKEELTAVHEVKTGESLWQIAIEYYHDGYQWPQIAKINKLSNPNLISPGQKLVIPKLEVSQKTSASQPASSQQEPITGENYTVKKGDCLWFIALRAYGDPYQWTKIASANKLVNPDLIHPGNKFVIPR